MKKVSSVHISVQQQQIKLLVDVSFLTAPAPVVITGVSIASKVISLLEAMWDGFRGEGPQLSAVLDIRSSYSFIAVLDICEMESDFFLLRSSSFVNHHGWLIQTELTNVGQKQDPLQALHDLITSKSMKALVLKDESPTKEEMELLKNGDYFCYWAEFKSSADCNEVTN
ncbi:hypothetical protein L2E82_38749 [Cichorium intybus]|uniref:Uncharacterized protein n=1 Tax=Cichorium intybus TaxID=13427 RepID=A0ACB9AI47_CICIN|nr:hypothetical protein L2E82_38749 [Cichorium intybus]